MSTDLKTNEQQKGIQRPPPNPCIHGRMETDPEAMAWIRRSASRPKFGWTVGTERQLTEETRLNRRTFVDGLKCGLK